VSALVGLSLACASSKLTVEKLPVSADPTAEIQQLSNVVQQARSAEVDVLSPTWFERASKSLARARSLREQGGSVQETLDAVAKGRAELQKANEFAGVARTTLPDAIAARQAARVAGATSLGDEYAEAEEAFLDLTRDIEDNELVRAQNRRDEVKKEFRALELKSIRDNTLASVRTTLAAAKAKDAARMAPQALATAEAKLKEAETFIAQNRYATEQMNELAQAALFQAKRALALTEYATEAKKRSPETQALDAEAFTSAISTELGGEDLRDRPIEEQQRILEAKVGELRKDRDFLVHRSDLLRSENERLSVELAAERGTAESLRSEQQFNQLYAEVQGYFDPKEAEVYKQGSRLLIRLRGVNFPVGDHVLQPEDYQILTKVQMAIRAFGHAHVVVEGHTDSTGSEAVNQRLSEQRAEAVREYMVANNVLPAEDIVAVGRGPSDPLAPNSTAAGRAENRRIDVIVDPQETPAVATGAGAP